MRVAQGPIEQRPAQPFPPQDGPAEIAPRTQLPAAGAAQDPSRLSQLPGLPAGFADPPQRPELQREYGRFVERTIDPEVTLDLIVGRPRILAFKETPTRIYLAQDSIASYDIISGNEISIIGVAPGRTVLTLWVNDPDRPGQQRILSYLLRVSQDAGYKVRLEAAFQALEKEINRDFPDSVVKLSLIGDQVVVRGQAKDVIEAAHILKIVAEHAPPSRRQTREQPTNLSISQTAYSPQGVLQTNEELGLTLDRLAAVAGLEGDANIVNLLTIPGEQQVMLRVTVAEVNRSALRSIGANMRIGGSGGVGFDSTFPPRVGDLVDTSLMVLEGGTLAVARGDFRLTIDALKRQNLARTLAEPNLVTLHGRPASFQAGGQFPVPSAAVGFGSAAQGVEFVPFGVQLQFVPFIVDRDKIRLNIAADISTTDEATGANVGGTQVPGLTTRNFQNTVELREGQTLAVAGLIQTNFGANSSRVPGLGDLPYIGRLFKSDSTSADEQELVILITPELVHPVDPEVCLSLPGSDVFEPGDIEFYIKGYMESRRTQDFQSPVRTDWARLQRYRHCEDLYILGPSGHSYGAREQAIFGGFSHGEGLAPAMLENERPASPEELPTPRPAH
ncbi:type II and III secretion system protein family protein [Lignipirellula cremea]|uniref:Type II secretion system protein D n=1 Tax=Lignipirellula cremea TaxID=2528010 RepID=A0A518E431_9BACT|nr:pilus assembly protein N-terminal domain-containing protein [Lignipirellula cremea]QDU98854.1 Type II secretion system protein D precursor [Lignipirellula cremea]